MIKTKIALAVLMTTLAVAPAGAATHHHHKAATTSAKKSGGKAASAKAGKSAKATKSTAKGKGKHAAAATAVTAVAAAPVIKAAVSERRQDRNFDSTSNQFLNALWRIDSESAIYAGKYDTAAMLSIPDKAGQAKELAFIDEWKQRLGAINASQLSAKQRTDLALLITSSIATASA